MPFLRVQIDSPLSPDDAIARLRGIVREPDGVFRSIQRNFTEFVKPPRTVVPFVGHIDGMKFRIHRDIRYQNSFLPMVAGRLEKSATGSRALLTMYLHPFVAAFLAVFLIAVSTTMTRVDDVEDLKIVGLIVAVMLVVFWFEANKAKKLLKSVLQKEPS